MSWRPRLKCKDAVTEDLEIIDRGQREVLSQDWQECKAIMKAVKTPGELKIWQSIAIFSYFKNIFLKSVPRTLPVSSHAIYKSVKLAKLRYLIDPLLNLKGFRGKKSSVVHGVCRFIPKQSKPIHRKQNDLLRKQRNGIFGFSFGTGDVWTNF